MTNVPPFGAHGVTAPAFTDEQMKEHAAEVREFQEAFGVFLPRVKEDSEFADDQLALLMVRVLWIEGAEGTVRREKARAALEQLRRALISLSNIVGAEASLWEVDRADAGPPQKQGVVSSEHARRARRRDASEARAAAKVVEFLGDLRIWRESDRLSNVIARIEKRALASIAETPETGRTGWRAVRAVDALRDLWLMEHKRAPAKALAPASNFGRFLHTGFAFLGLDADPRSAFNAWVRTR